MKDPYYSNILDTYASLLTQHIEKKKKEDFSIKKLP